MTREEAKELLPIMQAFAEGKTIEYRGCDVEWKVTNTPTWSNHLFTASNQNQNQNQNQSIDHSRAKKSVGRRYGFKHYIPLVFRKKYSA